MRKLITALALALIATSAMADFLRTDCFGNVYDGDLPFLLDTLTLSPKVASGAMN